MVASLLRFVDKDSVRAVQLLKVDLDVLRQAHDAVLREFRRVLVPGGRIIVAVVNPRSVAAARMAQKWFTRAGQPAYWPTRAEMRARVEAAGLRVRRQSPVVRVFGLPFLVGVPGFLPPVVEVVEGRRPAVAKQVGEMAEGVPAAALSRRQRLGR